MSVVRQLLEAGADGTSGIQGTGPFNGGGWSDLIETVQDPHWKIPDSTGIKRLLLTEIAGPEIFEAPIERLELSARTLNQLKRNHITNLGQVLDMSDDELLHIPNFGERSSAELERQLEWLVYGDLQ